MTGPIGEIALRETLSPKVQNFLEKLRLESTMGESDAFATQDSIAEAILNAATEDEIFAAADAGTLACKDYVGKAFLLNPDNIEVRVSTLRNDDGEINGLGFYLLLRVFDLETQGERVLNTGAQSLIATIMALRDGGHMDKYGKEGMPLILSGKSAGNGDVLILKPFKAYTAAKGAKAKAS